MAKRKSPRGTVVLLVRHGATPTTGRVLPGRAPGLHLSEAGRAQAAGVAERLTGVQLDAIYTSPLERAKETAAPPAAAAGLILIEEPGLLETDVGEWTGDSLAAAAGRKEWRELQTSPSTFRFPGGESFAELQERVVDVLDRLHGTHPDGTVACFTHADPIQMALTSAMGAPLDSFARMVVGTGSISAIRYPAGGTPLVLAVNSLTGPLTGLAVDG